MWLTILSFEDIYQKHINPHKTTRNQEQPIWKENIGPVVFSQTIVYLLLIFHYVSQDQKYIFYLLRRIKFIIFFLK